jgi:hypothetical protein
MHYLSWLLFALVPAILRGQTVVTGLYLSPVDFENNKLYHIEKHALVKLHEGIYKPFIEIIKKDERLRFRKDSLFGYMTSDLTVYRFYERKEYPVLFKGELLLYIIIPVRTKGGNDEPVYYFSRSAASAILKLKKSNLIKEFHDNSRFLDLLDQYFTDEEDLHLLNNNDRYWLDYYLELSKKP